MYALFHVSCMDSDGGPADVDQSPGFNNADPGEADSEVSETPTETLHSMGYNTGAGAEPSDEAVAESETSDLKADLVRLLAAGIPALLVLAFLWVAVVRPLV